MSIQTDSTPLEDPKNPDTDNVFALYQLIASAEQIEEMRQNYLNGNYGYGHAKTALFELILEKYSDARLKFDELMADTSILDKYLDEGAARAQTVGNEVLKRVREKLGLKV